MMNYELRMMNWGWNLFGISLNISFLLKTPVEFYPKLIIHHSSFIIKKVGGIEMKKKILIEGMSCNKCVAHVKEALEALQGVSSVEVSLEGKNAIVETTENDEVLKNAIEEEFYDVVGIEEI